MVFSRRRRRSRTRSFHWSMKTRRLAAGSPAEKELRDQVKARNRHTRDPIKNWMRSPREYVTSSGRNNWHNYVKTSFVQIVLGL